MSSSGNRRRSGLSELGGVLLVGSLAKVKIYTPYERRPA